MEEWSVWMRAAGMKVSYYTSIPTFAAWGNTAVLGSRWG
jgi:hypothetical protein